ncbi:hypothetical protein LWC33_19365 [Pseudonocardia sp. RS11V-5]|nr:hypothetical protein [Pseudonocardia terrae]MCE3553604.1 hypothetical protein [Pseudonocardia terrae]
MPDAPGLLDRMWWATGSRRGIDAAARALSAVREPVAAGARRTAGWTA